MNPADIVEVMRRLAKLWKEKLLVPLPLPKPWPEKF